MFDKFSSIHNLSTYMMRHIPLNIDCAQRPGGTKVLAFATAYASFVVDSRHLHRMTVGYRIIDHLDGVGRAVACTRTALVTFGHWYTVLGYPHRVTDVNSRFVLDSDRPYGACRADLRTIGALRAAVAALEGHNRLHQVQWIGGRAQHVVLAGTDAELACRAMPLHVPRRY